jgi:hypothetical protein
VKSIRKFNRRTFLKNFFLWLVAFMPTKWLWAKALGLHAKPGAPKGGTMGLPIYRGPRVILIRFGGGVRRKETIDPDNTYSPFFCHEMTKSGVLYKNMEIAQLKGINTSHGEGTLNLLTGKFDTYKDVEGKFLGARFEAKVPTLFEYLRKSYQIAEHEAFIINGEDRTEEEFYSFSNHHQYGVKYRCNVLSLYRYKLYLLEQKIADGKDDRKTLEGMKKKFAKLQALDYRVDAAAKAQDPVLKAFWERWRRYYGDSGLVNPRGDRLLTELTLWALRELKPRFMMINFQDPDYVHWGNPAHYTRAISVIDDGIRRIVEAVEADVEYRNNTVFVVAPDCGRDNNPFLPVPFQHHFGDRTAHEVFALFTGPGISKGKVVDRKVQQISVAPTIGKIMRFETPFTEGPVLPEVFG